VSGAGEDRPSFGGGCADASTDPEPPLSLPVAVDFARPPANMEDFLGIRTHVYRDRSLAIGTALACMEREEQRRVRVWHGLTQFPIIPIGTCGPQESCNGAD